MKRALRIAMLCTYALTIGCLLYASWGFLMHSKLFKFESVLVDSIKIDHSAGKGLHKANYSYTVSDRVYSNYLWVGGNLYAQVCNVGETNIVEYNSSWPNVARLRGTPYLASYQILLVVAGIWLLLTAFVDLFVDKQKYIDMYDRVLFGRF